MKVVVKKIGEFEVNNIPYKEARKLYQKNLKIFHNKKEEDIDTDGFYAFLEEVRVISGISEEDLTKYSMPEVDTILQTVLMEYCGLNPKS